MAILLSTFLLCTCIHTCLAYGPARYDAPEALLNEAFAQVIKGVPVLRIESIDPLYFSYFEGNFPTMQYKSYNNTVRGLSNCKITKNIFSSDRKMVYFVLDCPGYVLYAANEVQGYALYVYMYGRGNLEIYYGRYVIAVYAQVSYTKDYYGNTCFKIGPFSLDVSSRSATNYNFMHLYNNNKYKSEAISKFGDDNCEAVAVYTKDPMWYTMMKIIVARMNQCTCNTHT